MGSHSSLRLDRLSPVRCSCSLPLQSLLLMFWTSLASLLYSLWLLCLFCRASAPSALFYCDCLLHCRDLEAKGWLGDRALAWHAWGVIITSGGRHLWNLVLFFFFFLSSVSKCSFSEGCGPSDKALRFWLDYFSIAVKKSWPFNSAYNFRGLESMTRFTSWPSSRR